MREVSTLLQKLIPINTTNHSQYQVALSVDAIQITGHATLLEHPSAEANKELVHYVEERLPNQFARYQDSPIMRVIKITPAQLPSSC